MKSTPHFLLLDASGMVLFEQPDVKPKFFCGLPEISFHQKKPQIPAV